MLRHPWASALRSAEQGLKEERSRLSRVVPQRIEEYNAAVGMEYLKVKL